MSIVTTAEARDHLGGISAAVTPDPKLQTWINRAEGAITRRVRELASTPSQVVRVDGCGRRGLALPTGQAIASVESVTPVGGAAIPLSELYVNKAAGVIEYNLGGYFTARAYDVGYTAGFAATPEDIKLAVLELVRHFFESQRGGAGRVRGGQSVDEDKLPGYLLPYRVRELLRPFLRTPVA